MKNILSPIPVKPVLASVAACILAACTSGKMTAEPAENTITKDKFVVYQVFTRLFGNKNTTNKPWGTIEENGVGKFSDFTPEALQGIKQLGVTHIWYTGVPHHALINDYTEYGISNDDPDVVKGRAGSPYAVKDYYSVNPDLANDPANRVAEFEALIERTHAQDMKVIIDIVPNHIARKYESLGKPDGVEDFGASDNTQVEYARDNNFYYIPGKEFEVPEYEGGYQPLGGEAHPAADGQFDENPAKWTGNGSRKAQPNSHDWYETVKINYGVRPDGSHDFADLPDSYALKDYQQHYAFWQTKSVPDSWKKFKDIALFWTEKGVDGFRFDMAEMVPVEFWSYMNSAIKMANPDAFLLAEIYNPARYRDYIHLGKMDYLYDKVDFYDSIKRVMQGKDSTDHLVSIQSRFADIEHHLLHFLDNHDEQRLPSPDFAGSAEKGRPAMVVSATVSSSPMMIYFGQEVGEDGSENMGFGTATRTTIFDYAGVPAHQRWMNDGKFDGGQLSSKELALRDFYQRLLTFTKQSSAMTGDYADLHLVNRSANHDVYTDKLFSYARFDANQKLFVIANFSEQATDEINLIIPAHVIDQMQLSDGKYQLAEQLYGKYKTELIVEGGTGYVQVQLTGLESFILEVQ